MPNNSINWSRGHTIFQTANGLALNLNYSLRVCILQSSSFGEGRSKKSSKQRALIALFENFLWLASINKVSKPQSSCKHQMSLDIHLRSFSMTNKLLWWIFLHKLNWSRCFAEQYQFKMNFRFANCSVEKYSRRHKEWKMHGKLTTKKTISRQNFMRR